jgi:uncharacterized Fe-S center protein
MAQSTQPAKVYFLDDRAERLGESIQNKAVKVLRDAGLESMIKKGDKVGIKCHMGEWGNSLNLRPHWIGRIVAEVKRLGGEPVVFDTCTATYGNTASRASKADYLRTAAAHGFCEQTMGCPVVIADGDHGIDDVKIDVPHGVILKYVYMATGILDFDKVIVVSHFKGHIQGVYGAALKNVGIGMASARGKQAVHFISDYKCGAKTWKLDEAACAKMSLRPRPNALDKVAASCPQGAFSYDGKTFSRNPAKCKLCGFCFGLDGYGIFDAATKEKSMEMIVPAIADSASGIINKIGKENCIFVTYAMDITPWCDCTPFHDRSLVPNIGVFASRDPVALDTACVEAEEDESVTPGSAADTDKTRAPHTERFTNASSMAHQGQWEQINTACYNGLGTTEYTLVHSKAAPDSDFILPPYTMDKDFYAMHKDEYKNISVDVGDYSYDVNNPNVPLETLRKKPVGKVGEETLDE